MTPYEVYYGKKPFIAHLRIFGSYAYVHVHKDTRTKLDPRSRKCIFVGYSEESKAYKVYDPSRKQVIISKDVVFEETSLPAAPEIQAILDLPSTQELPKIPTPRHPSIPIPEVPESSSTTSEGVDAGSRDDEAVESTVPVPAPPDTTSTRKLPQWYLRTLQDSGVTELPESSAGVHHS